MSGGEWRHWFRVELLRVDDTETSLTRADTFSAIKRSWGCRFTRRMWHMWFWKNTTKTRLWFRTRATAAAFKRSMNVEWNPPCRTMASQPRFVHIKKFTTAERSNLTVAMSISFGHGPPRGAQRTSIHSADEAVHRGLAHHYPVSNHISSVATNIIRLIRMCVCILRYNTGIIRCFFLFLRRSSVKNGPARVLFSRLHFIIVSFFFCLSYRKTFEHWRREKLGNYRKNRWK